jgi:RNA polymerase sigma factor (sigma-70 family)
MSARSKTTPTDIAHYEGLVRKTAALYVNHVELDYDDIVQVLRIKVWRALEAHDPRKVKTQTLERFIFMCVKNQCKDLIRRRHRGEVYLEDLIPDDAGTDWAEWMVQLSADHEQTYGAVEDDELFIPSTLTGIERAIVAWLYLDRTQKEVAGLLGLTRAEMERAVKVIRQKMADWQPSPRTTVTIPVPIEPALRAAA